MAEQILRLPAVQKRTALSRSTILCLVDQGLFPAPIRLSVRCVGWIETELDEWITQRVEASRNGGCVASKS